MIHISSKGPYLLVFVIIVLHLGLNSIEGVFSPGCGFSKTHSMCPHIDLFPGETLDCRKNCSEALELTPLCTKSTFCAASFIFA